TDLAVGFYRPRAAGQVLDRLLNDLQALQHLLHAHQIAGITVPRRGTDDLEIEVFVGEVRLVFAQVAHHAAGPGNRSGAAQVDGIFLGEHADALGPLDENAVAIEEPHHVGIRLGKVLDEGPYLLHKRLAD